MNNQIKELQKYIRKLTGIRINKKLYPLYNNNETNLEFIYPKDLYGEKEIKIVSKNINKYIEKNDLNCSVNYVVEDNSYNLKVNL